MSQWPFAMPPMPAKPPLPMGIPEEWQKANKALQAVRQHTNTDVSESTSNNQDQSGVVSDYGLRWPGPHLYPSFPGYAGYPPSYGHYYNYNFSPMVNMNTYFINPMPPQIPMAPSTLSDAPNIVKMEELNSGCMNVPSVSQPPLPASPSSPTNEAAFFTDITSSQAPGSGSIKFNLPKKKNNTNTTFQATRDIIQQRMSHFRNVNGNPESRTDGNEMTYAHRNMEEQKSVTNHWPQSLKNYVSRSFDKCKTDLDKDQVELILKGKLLKANTDGWLETKDWDDEPLPNIHSDRLEQEQKEPGLVQKQHVFLQKLPNVLRNQNKKEYLVNSRSFQNKGKNHTYHSRSRSRSYSRSRSRSRSPPPRKVIPRRRYSSSSDSSGDLIGSGSRKTLSSSVIGPSDFRISKNIPNSVIKNKKKGKRKKVPFTVDPEFCTDERLLKRAARFDVKRAKSSKANNLMCTITNPFVIDETGADIEWGNIAVMGTCEDVEKPYLRLTGAVDPSTVRPEEVLMKSLTIVKKHWIENQDYHFACEQLKSIRQDLVVQCIRSKFTVQVYETHARIALEKGDHTEFNQCQSQLKALYPEIDDGNRLEFTGYHILYTIYTDNSIELKNILADLTLDEKCDEVVSHAFQLSKAWSSNNYCRFFKLYLSSPKMSSFIIDWFIEKVRKAALKAIIKSFRPNLPVSHIQSALAFPSTEECLAFLTKANLVFVDAGIINCKESAGPVVNF